MALKPGNEERLAASLLRACDDAAVFDNIAGWATLLYGDGRTLGGVRNVLVTATGLATTLRKARAR